jgi:hypothetical protein
MSKVRVETDAIELAAELFDPFHRSAEDCRGDPASAMGRGCGRTRLW